MYQAKRLYIRFIRWRQDMIGNRSFIVLLSIIVGLLAAIAALVLKTLIHFIESNAYSVFPAFFYFLLPLTGIIITSLIYQRVYKRASGFHGLPGVLNSIRRKYSFIHYSLMYAQLVTGAITSGFGGSAGLESPTVVTGSAIGSNTSRFFRLDYKYRTLFIGCGAAATIAAIFNAPIAGVIFATEVILPQFSSTIFIPILISAATGAFFAGFFVGSEALFQVKGVSAFQMEEIPLILVLGLFTGFVSLYFTKVFKISKALMETIRFKWMRTLSGGLLLGCLVFLFPPLFGEGYISISLIVQGKSQFIADQSVLGFADNTTLTLLFVIGALILLKPLASSLTVHAGGEGGQFAPSFVTGGFAGFFFYLVAVSILPYSDDLNPVNYVLMGMGAVLAGVMHAPLTAIFLVAEVTQSYDLLIGLMLVTAMSYLTKLYFDKVSIHFTSATYGRQMETGRHEFISINNLRLREMINKNFITLEETQTPKELFELFRQSDQVIFPVVRKGELKGVISLTEIRSLLNESVSLENKLVRDIMVEPLAVIQPTDPMDLVVHMFDVYSSEDYLPVCKGEKYIGMVSRTDVLASFREALKTSNEFLD